MRRTKRVLSGAALLFGFGHWAPAVAADAQGAYTALGEGTVSCANWISHRKAGDWAPLGAWISGYLTAYNEFVWKGQNIADKSTLDEIDRWMDGYCATHPLSDLTAAVGQLAISLDGQHNGAVLQNQFGP